MDDCTAMLAESGMPALTTMIVVAAIVLAAGIAAVVVARRTQAHSGATLVALLLGAALLGGSLTAAPAAHAACTTPAPAATVVTPTAEPSVPAPTDPTMTATVIRQCDAFPQVIVRIANMSADDRVVDVEWRSTEGVASGDAWAVPAGTTVDVPGYLSVDRTVIASWGETIIAEQHLTACPPQLSAFIWRPCMSDASIIVDVTNPTARTESVTVVATALDGTVLDSRVVDVAASATAQEVIAIDASSTAVVTVTAPGSPTTTVHVEACPISDVIVMTLPVCAVENAEGARVSLTNMNAADVIVRVDVSVDGTLVSSDEVNVPANGYAAGPEPAKSTQPMTITVSQGDDDRIISQTEVPGCDL